MHNSTCMELKMFARVFYKETSETWEMSEGSKNFIDLSLSLSKAFNPQTFTCCLLRWPSFFIPCVSSYFRCVHPRRVPWTVAIDSTAAMAFAGIMFASRSKSTKPILKFLINCIMHLSRKVYIDDIHPCSVRSLLMHNQWYKFLNVYKNVYSAN